MKIILKKTDITMELVIAAVIGITLIFGILLFREDVDYRNESYCKWVENDAKNIVAAMYEYFSWPDHTDIKKSDIEEETFTDNPWTLTDDGDEFVIQVFDKSEKCSDAYQKESPEWDSNRYTFKILKEQVL